MIELPSAELVRKPLSWRLKRGSRHSVRCLIFACGITLTVETARSIAERRSEPVWVETRETCEILNRRIDGVTGIGGDFQSTTRIHVDGEVRWYGFATKIWTLTVEEDMPFGRGYAEIECQFISGKCIQHVRVHLPSSKTLE